MSAPDDLDRLRDGLRAGAPAPDAAVRAEALRRAMESFDAHQDLGRAARHGKDRRKQAGFIAGARAMYDRLTTRAALGATASFAILAVGAWTLTGPRAPDLLPGLAPPDAEQATVAAPEVPLADAIPASRSAASGTPVPEAMSAPVSRLAGPPGMAKQTARALTYPAPAPAPSPVSPVAETGADSFAAFDPNPLKVTIEAPVSTFSVDVDTASWSWVRVRLMWIPLRGPGCAGR